MPFWLFVVFKLLMFPLYCNPSIHSRWQLGQPGLMALGERWIVCRFCVPNQTWRALRRSKAKPKPLFFFSVEPGRLRCRILRLQTYQNQVFEKERRVSERVDEGWLEEWWRQTWFRCRVLPRWGQQTRLQRRWGAHPLQLSQENLLRPMGNRWSCRRKTPRLVCCLRHHRDENGYPRIL